ncbi:acyl-CoA dehydrogenase family protein [Paeniglutamicibacter terrestris]|uniref:Acyl-CoA dehydrogenase n=1 Tax=Paeniglutamicibacter terrestris TaxID=2723403 RepID=A0ABX1G0R5_9MICC|nr:acyl-CoA dehydrogenase family protein [Paeniglutamicibacter terrestris]NKG19814.1 acyl-CoA dehydrogenase [Paeniglutamicibacter terrestris]
MTAIAAFEDINSDFLKIDQLLGGDDRTLVLKLRDFVNAEVLPIINEHWETADFPYHLIPKIAQLGIIGTSISGYGCPGLTRMQTGLVAMELSRGDGSFNTFNAVHSGLAMGTIYLHGSEEQRQRWLPQMARLEKLGAFALTEPDHGSDTVALETSARFENGEWVLNGAKRWIGLGHVADLVIVWARDEADGKVKAFVVEKQDGQYPQGYSAEAITGKIAKRGIQQAAITLENVKVPAGNRLENARGFRAVTAVLNRTRTTVAWEALGHAQASYELAVRYSQQRKQFGRPISHNQLVQNKLATMLADLTAMQLMCVRCGQLQDQGDLTQQQASLQKMFVSDKARDLCRDARDLMGGNGLLLENHVARHMLDMEVVHTYEGTHFIQSLIVGREITGHNAIS